MSTHRARAPTFLQKPAIRQGDGGKKIIFETRTSADPLPKFTWFRNDIELSDGGRYKFVTKDEGNSSYYIALELTDPQHTDAATYKVHAQNSHGQSTANLKLNFDTGASKGQPPKFTAKPAIRQTNDGCVEFEVSLIADPSPDITWLKDTTVLKDGGRYSISTRTDGVSYVFLLRIRQVEASDGGLYVVKASNKHGESNASLQLNLESSAPSDGKAPSFTEKPSIKQESSKIVMSCVVQAEPKPDVEWFHNEKKLATSNRVVTSVTEMSSTSYQLQCVIMVSTFQLFLIIH